MTAREKVLYAEQQIRAVLAQEVAVITCPFCDALNTFDSSDGEHDMELCCEPLAELVDVIVTHTEALDQKKQLDRIADRHFTAQRNMVTLN